MIFLIEAKPGLSAEELARICGISIRNCFRDLQVLCCAGVPIYNDNGYRLLEKSRLQKISEPYQIVYRDGFWYLVAYCHLRDEIRLFRVDRIRKLEYGEGHFHKPVDFDLENYLGSAWQMERGEECVFRVRFWGGAARYARETRFHPSQEIQEMPDGSLLLTAKACSLKSVSRWVLQFGGEAVALEPVELREMVLNELRGAVGNYD
jgi:predicted DNA-binding transcriptional regulator YafY